MTHLTFCDYGLREWVELGVLEKRGERFRLTEYGRQLIVDAIRELDRRPEILERCRSTADICAAIAGLVVCLGWDRRAIHGEKLEAMMTALGGFIYATLPEKLKARWDDP